MSAGRRERNSANGRLRTRNHERGTENLDRQTAHRAPRTAHRAPRTAHRAPRTAHRAPRTAHRELHKPRTARTQRAPNPRRPYSIPLACTCSAH
ncbi:hypothetical protein F9948_08140 [Burkholderia thailandensis]|nr:hypothetical protein [Burkholderia thailandensis]